MSVELSEGEYFKNEEGKRIWMVVGNEDCAQSDRRLARCDGHPSNQTPLVHVATPYSRVLYILNRNILSLIRFQRNMEKLSRPEIE